MKLTLNNIGSISSAEIQVDGITVIAGKNNAGKSTVGKTLYSVFNSFYKYNDKIKQERINNLRGFIFNELDEIDLEQYHILNKILTNNINNSTKLISELSDFINKCSVENIELSSQPLDIDNLTVKISERLNISDDDILTTYVNRQINTVFNKSINNIFSDEIGLVQIDIQKLSITATFSNDSVVHLSDKINLKTKSIYIDNPFLIDRLDTPALKNSGLHYNDHLYNLLTSDNEVELIDEILAKQKLDIVTSKLDAISNYTLVKGEYGTYKVAIDGASKTLPIQSISTGIKTFLILKTLLLNGSIEENGTIILDEPEVHLHPEWQLAFAEIIVLLHKQFNLHVLLTTHSPYFLHAIETYSKVYDVKEKCNYYLSRIENDFSYFDNVTNDTSKIYDLLYNPFQTLETLEYGNE